MMKPKLFFVPLLTCTVIAFSEPMVSAQYHHVADCAVCHYYGQSSSSEDCRNSSNLKGIRDTITTPNSGEKPVVYEGSLVRGEEPYDGVCEVCHTSTSYYRNDGSGDTHYPGMDCLFCHKKADNYTVQPFDHTATPGSGWVTIFPDDGHDDAGWIGDKPYFDVFVDCSACHKNDLLAVHGADLDTLDHCSTCHPTPYNTLGTWDRSCQQGDCHIVYHEGSPEAHEPFEDPYDPGNDCNRCHDQSSWEVEPLPEKCLNCHATYDSADTTAPVTTTNALPWYVGPANIDLWIYDEDNAGEVGVGITFYKLDSGPETAGTNLFVSALDPYPHVLELWSKDQAGNVETPHFVNFFIDEDLLPPTTTSNVQATYNQGAVITLTATDDGTLGVKNTYLSINGGPTQTGTRVNIPPAAIGTSVDYTLDFWSDDWSGNTEPQNSVTFTVLGNGTLKLVWGNSDNDGSPCPSDPEADASWTIWRGGWNGPVVASGADWCPGWSGVNYVGVPVSDEPYFVRVEWWWSDEGWYDQTDFPNIYVDEPSDIIRLSY